MVVDVRPSRKGKREFWCRLTKCSHEPEFFDSGEPREWDKQWSPDSEGAVCGYVRDLHGEDPIPIGQEFEVEVREGETGPTKTYHYCLEEQVVAVVLPAPETPA